MLRLSSVDAVLHSLGEARALELYAFTLHPGPVLAGLEGAARRGARVRVRLSGESYGAGGPALLRRNRVLVDELVRCGADAELLPAGNDRATLHAKALIADGRLFLDDQNFGARDFVVRDDAVRDADAFRGALAGGVSRRLGSVAFDKPRAVAAEAALVRNAPDGADVVVESETFGYGRVYSALAHLAARGGAPRLLVSDREARANSRERAALEGLAAAGVRVRLCRDSEKFALVGAAAWVGSANASPAFGVPPAVDWGVTTRSVPIVTEARRRIEQAWNAGRALRIRRPER